MRTLLLLALLQSGGDAPPTYSGRAGNAVRVDWLVSCHPTPATVFYARYGNSLTEPDPLAFRDLHRTSDGFFVKFSYLFRMQ